MKLFFVLVFFSFIHLNAYCISNNTQQSIFFMVEFYPKKADSILTFKNYIKPNETLCCDKTNKSCNPIGNSNSNVSFYAFLNEDSIEGCDIFGTVNSHITLNSYEVFDNCRWK